MLLYKFLPLGDALVAKTGKTQTEIACDVLRTGEFYFSSRDELNDMFELRPYFDLRLSEDVRLDFVDAVKRAYPGMNRSGFEQFTLEEHVPSIVSEMLMRFKGDFQQRVSKVGICSLANTNENPLLWGHYAASGKGIAIAVDIPDDRINRDCVRVVYSKNPPVVSASNIFNAIDDFKNFKDTASRIFITKFDSWVYEDEVRILRFDESSKCISLGVPIEEVCFGPNTDDAVKQELRTQFPGIKFRDTRLSDNEYKVIST